MKPPKSPLICSGCGKEIVKYDIYMVDNIVRDHPKFHDKCYYEYKKKQDKLSQMSIKEASEYLSDMMEKEAFEMATNDSREIKYEQIPDDVLKTLPKHRTSKDDTTFIIEYL